MSSYSACHDRRNFIPCLVLEISKYVFLCREYYYDVPWVTKSTSTIVCVFYWHLNYDFLSQRWKTWDSSLNVFFYSRKVRKYCGKWSDQISANTNVRTFSLWKVLQYQSGKNRTCSLLYRVLSIQVILKNHLTDDHVIKRRWVMRRVTLANFWELANSQVSILPGYAAEIETTDNLSFQVIKSMNHRLTLNEKIQS